MRRPSPELVPAEHELSTTTASARDTRSAVAPTREERDRAAVRRQLEALERYYGIATGELIARRAGGVLPSQIAGAEAARWAELHATLVRLTGGEAARPPSAEPPTGGDAEPSRTRLRLA